MTSPSVGAFSLTAGIVGCTSSAARYRTIKLGLLLRLTRLYAIKLGAVFGPPLNFGENMAKLIITEYLELVTRPIHVKYRILGPAGPDDIARAYAAAVKRAKETP